MIIQINRSKNLTHNQMTIKSWYSKLGSGTTKSVVAEPSLFSALPASRIPTVKLQHQGSAATARFLGARNLDSSHAESLVRRERVCRFMPQNPVLGKLDAQSCRQVSARC